MSPVDELDGLIGRGDITAGRIIRLTILMRELGPSPARTEVTPGLFRAVPHLAHFAPLAEQILGEPRATTGD